MPAWSEPACHRVLLPSILWNRVNASMIVSWNACPMCKLPVTFGGGIMMQYGAPAPRGAKYPLDSQRSYQ